jgi:hypothetical protein
MAPMSRLRILTALVCASALVACEKNAVQDITQPTSGAFIRFQNYGVNAPGVNFYANDQKLTAVSSASCTPSTDARCVAAGIESTTGVVYGGSANGGNYSMIAPGQYTLTGRIAATADNGLPISTMSTTLTDGKFYTYIMSGIYSAASKTSDAFIIEDALPTTFDYTKAYIRIVNASVNAPRIGVSSKLQGTSNNVLVGQQVQYKGASPFVTIEPGLTDLTVVLDNNPTPFVFTNFNLFGGHVFTLTLRGDATSSTATGLTLTLTANR